MLKQISVKKVNEILKNGGKLTKRYNSYWAEEKYIEYAKDGTPIIRYSVVGFITFKNYKKVSA